MRTALVLVVLLAAGCTTSPPSTPHVTTLTPSLPVQASGTEHWSFDDQPKDVAPVNTQTFSGSWFVRSAPDAPSGPNILCQEASATFPAIALGSTSYTDVDLSAKAKPLSGSEDQAIGLIFRIQDANNYYIVRANALEGTLELFRYVNGERSDIVAADTPVTGMVWHDIRITAQGSTITGYFDGRELIHTDDSTFSAGRVGLWTKADSISCFDEVTARRL